MHESIKKYFSYVGLFSLIGIGGLLISVILHSSYVINLFIIITVLGFIGSIVALFLKLPNKTLSISGLLIGGIPIILWLFIIFMSLISGQWM